MGLTVKGVQPAINNGLVKIRSIENVTWETTSVTLQQGTHINIQLLATSNPSSTLTYTVQSGTSLPIGLTLHISGLLTGTPSGTGSYSFGVYAKNTSGDFALNVFSGSINPDAVINISSGTISLTEGSPVSYQVSFTDISGATLTYSAANLPSGLTINTSTGVISGTPTTTGAYNFTVSATDGYASNSQSFTGTISAPAYNTSITLTSNQQNYNLFTAAGSPTVPVNMQLTINPGVYVYSNSTSSPAILMSGFPAGSTLTLINNGYITGQGGEGGYGGSFIFPSGYDYTISVSPAAGLPGGPALSLTMPVTISGSGYIAGGGGGGGSGYGTTSSQPPPLGIGGGGGGAGNGSGAGVAGDDSLASNGVTEPFNGFGGPGGDGGMTVPGTGGAAGSGTIAASTYFGTSSATGTMGRAGGSGTAAGGGGAGSGGGAGAAGGSANNAGGNAASNSGGGGGGGGWGAPGGHGGGAVPQAGGAGGNSIILNGHTYSNSGNTLWGAVS